MKQVERSSHSRSALIGAARELWAERGYAGVGTPEIAAAAGLTRGAMYHQFAGKRDLFAATLETVEAELTQRIVARVSPEDPLKTAVIAWLDACEEPEVRQIILLDGPVVLGWDGLRDITLRYGLGLTEQLLGGTRALAHVVIGALNEAAMFVAHGGSRHEAEAALDVLMTGLQSS
jgi:AcrR family transcriptional regulator